MDNNIVMAGEEKAMAEKSPMGSLSMAPKTQSSMRPPRTAWQETSSRVLRSGKVKRLEVAEVRMTGVTTVICRQHRSSSSCQGLAGTEQILTSLMVALLGERERQQLISDCRDSRFTLSIYHV